MQKDVKQPVEYLNVGRILGTHGVRGDVSVRSMTDYPEARFAKGQRLFLAHESLSKPFPLTVKQARPHKNALLVQFEEWTNLNHAEPFKGGTLMILAEEATEVEEDAYYYHQIVGCTVYTTEGELVGVVKEILPLPANDVWVVQENGSNEEILIPYISDVVKEVHPDQERIVIQWIEGLK